MSIPDLMTELDDAIGKQFSYPGLSDWAQLCVLEKTALMRRLNASSPGYEDAYYLRERWRAVGRVFNVLADEQARECARSADTEVEA